MATKIQLEAMVTKILELQYYGETVHCITLGNDYILIHTGNYRTVKLDTDGKETKT